MPMGGRLGQTLSRLGNIRLGAGPASSGPPGGVTRPTDKTLPYIGHLYDNAGNFKRLLDPFLNRPALKQTLNGGFQPITLDMPLPVRLYGDVVGGDAPGAYYRLGDASGSAADLLGGLALAATVLDKSASMSFANAGLLTGGDATTCLKNASAVPTTGYLFGGNTFWPVSQPTAWSIEFVFSQRVVANINNPIFRHQGVNDGSGNPNDELMIYIDASGNLQFYVHPPNTGLSFTSATGYAPSLGTTAHHCLLVNTNGTYTLYVDGVLRYTSPGGTYQPQLGQGFQVGAHPGNVQELAIYDTSLSATQASNHNAARSAGNYQGTVTGDSPLGYWRLGEASGSVIAEPMVGQMRLLLKSPVYAQAPLVNDDKSIQFGSVGNGSGVGGHSGFSASTPRPITGTKFAIEAWLKPGTLIKDRIGGPGESWLNGRCIAYAGDITSTTGIGMAQHGVDVVVGAPGAGVTFANKLTAGRHHVVWVYDSSLGSPYSLYVDGQLVGTAGGAALSAPAAGLAIGFVPPFNPSFHAGFGGEIDEVAYWNFALTAAQVLTHYKAGTDMTQGDMLTLTEQGGDGTVLYKGIIEDIPDDYDLSPSFQIGVQPMVVQLADAFFSVNYNTPTDIGQMVRDAVGATGNITWTATTIPLTGTLAQVDFTDSTALAVLEHCKKIGGPLYWWFVDQNGVLWFQQFDLTRTPLFSTKRGVDHNARRYRSPIGTLKNKVLCIGNIPPNASVPIQSIYSDAASQSQYGVRTHWPPLVYPNIIDQATLDKVAATVGSELNRRTTKIELELPSFALILLGVDKGATMRYWEPNKNPLLEASVGSGRYSATYVILDVEQDGPHQKVILAEIPIASDDLQYEGDRQLQRDFLQQLLHPGLGSTVPTALSGGFFASAVGTIPTLPSGFTGWSLDAQNGLSLYNAGTLIARYGSDGGAGVLQAYSGYQPVDSTHKAVLRFELPANAVNIINKIYLSFSLKAFRATTQGTSGASSASSSGGTSTNHSHTIVFASGSAGEAVRHLTLTSEFESVAGGGANTANQSADHTHNIAHTHSLTAPDGLYDTGMAQGVHVYIDGTDRTTALGGAWGAGSAIDVSDLDISSYISSTGWHEILLSSTSLGVIIAQVTTKAQLITV